MIWKTFVIFIIDMWLVRSVEENLYPSRNPQFWGFFYPPAIQRQPSRLQRTPLDIIVDLTNDLGVAILQDHSTSKGNFAFSPYGVASVLVILYEGARGESAYQIHKALGFPFNKEIIRMGFKDLHHHLKSYFNHESFLSGITLNKEGSKLEPEYRNILKFYGYDVDLSHFAENETDKINETTTSSSERTTKATTSVSSGMELITGATEADIGMEETTTVMPDITTVKSTVTEIPTVEQTTLSVNETKEDKIGQIQAEESKCGKNEKQSNLQNEELCMGEEGNGENKVVENQPDNLEEPSVNNQQKENTTVSNSSENAGGSDSENSSSAKNNTTIPNEVSSSLDNGMLIPQAEDQISTTLPPTTTTQDPTEETSTSPNLETTTPVTIETTQYFKNEKVVAQDRLSNEVNMTAISSKNFIKLKENEHKLRRKKTITDYLKSPSNPDLSFQFRNGMYDAHVYSDSDFSRALPKLLFLVDGVVDTPVPMMTFTTVFPFGHIPWLHAKALEFPLDDVRYKLLILLPMESKGLRRLIYDLTDFSLQDVVKSLRPTRVKTTLPTFMVEGFVILTSSLQKLGISDVFDPRRSNLSGMSLEPELYVRNIEQSVTVVIKNYLEVFDIQTRTMAVRNFVEEFEADHPFLYFVLDSTTNVALMAGQMLNPLNSRMY